MKVISSTQRLNAISGGNLFIDGASLSAFGIMVGFVGLGLGETPTPMPEPMRVFFGAALGYVVYSSIQTVGYCFDLNTKASL